MMKLSRRRSFNALGTFVSGLCACSNVVMTNIILNISGHAIEYSYKAYILRHFLYSIPFALLFFFNIPMRFTADRSIKKKLVKHLTFVCILLHGITGTIYMQSHLPADINSYPALFWFTYGVVAFFLGAADRMDLLVYGAVYIGSIVLHMLNFGDFSFDEKLSLIVIMFQLLHFTPVALLARSRISAIRHAFRQLEKVFYPHQIKMIRKGLELEQSMPTTSGFACVICFDIIDSSRIERQFAKVFFRNVFARCNTIMMEGYNGVDLASSGYRIKELGDGFYCSVGYPFRSKSARLAEDALDLARRFHEAFRIETAHLELEQPLHCSIGIAWDAIIGFYPESGAREYDLYGPAIVLATRYEQMRKSIFPGKPPSSLIIIQERVWSELQDESRLGFLALALGPKGLVVRDDPKAIMLYYELLSESNERIENPQLSRSIAG